MGKSTSLLRVFKIPLAILALFTIGIYLFDGLQRIFSFVLVVPASWFLYKMISHRINGTIPRWFHKRFYNNRHVLKENEGAAGTWQFILIVIALIISPTLLMWFVSFILYPNGGEIDSKYYPAGFSYFRHSPILANIAWVSALVLPIWVARTFRRQRDYYAEDVVEQEEKENIKKSYGSKTWATDKELRAVLHGDRSPINIGNGYMWHGEGHIMTCAPTRSGKGFYIINTALTDNSLRDPGASSFIVMDPKGENIRISGDYLRSVGYEVYCINPYDIAGLEEFGLSKFNPLDDIDPFSDDTDEILDTIAYSIIPPSDHKNKFFDDAGRDFLLNCLRHLLTQTEDEISFRTLYYYVLSTGTDLEILLKKMAVNRHFDGVITKYAMSVAGQKGTDAWGSISRTAQTAMTMFGRKRLASSLSGSDFKMSDLNDKKVAVFLCMPSDVIQKNAPWLRIFFGSMLRELMKNYHPKRRITLLMDEFIKLGYLKEAEDFFTIGAQYATIWAVVQDLDALSKIYGGWQSLVGNCAVNHWFAAGDNLTRDYISRRMPMTVQFMGNNKDGSPRYNEKPLLRPDEVGSFPDIILELSAMESPARLPKIPYLQQNKNGRNLRAMA
ncbi:type IV secretory system conjugative DNA transfer family protein [Dyadobacter sp. CY323]|uniref:type IV secretory system conjugative DNA transfer family protein n=1 Tax=Dyadobacter sp. CY323 TaxID=2907302 RepID=UPI001F47DC45|nr:type IV secretory system conjugative DNA transfer family protein [Dyadobacter sp. CY323]MCE6993127.1 type IV secretory system conjugative DNA transfer family protein [Dyadobacter sp. CY323]